MFHSARALLFRDGLREKNHFCVARYLGRYVEDGSLEPIWVSLLDRVRELRHPDQYNLSFATSQGDAREILDVAGRFLTRMEGLLAG
jgi:uncharacterized protein (UPF0332 family)